MTLAIAYFLVVTLGAAICLFAAWGLYAPQKLVSSVKGILDTAWGIYFAVSVRIALGLGLIVLAPASRFPRTFVILGWIALIAGVAVAIMGKERLRGLANWWLDRFSPSAIRLWLLAAVAFGAFLVYGAV